VCHLCIIFIVVLILIIIKGSSGEGLATISPGQISLPLALSLSSTSLLFEDLYGAHGLHCLSTLFLTTGIGSYENENMNTGQVGGTFSFSCVSGLALPGAVDLLADLLFYFIFFFIPHAIYYCWRCPRARAHFAGHLLFDWPSSVCVCVCPVLLSIFCQMLDEPVLVIAFSPRAPQRVFFGILVHFLQHTTQKPTRCILLCRGSTSGFPPPTHTHITPYSRQTDPPGGPTGALLLHPRCRFLVVVQKGFLCGPAQ
jgi:hypothetical protein